MTENVAETILEATRKPSRRRIACFWGFCVYILVFIGVCVEAGLHSSDKVDFWGYGVIGMLFGPFALLLAGLLGLLIFAGFMDFWNWTHKT